jgi:hypothetical protein
MKSTSNGISLSRKELTALLAFASQNEAEKNMWGVHFRVEGEKVFARASNGYAHLELEGLNEAGPDGEWLVARKFLVDGQKELESKQVLRLEFRGASLHEAAVLENDVELGRWQSAKDVAISQVSFPWDGVKLPSSSRKIAHCCAISAPYLKLVMLAAKAVGVEIFYLYGPKDAAGDVTFTVGHEEQTSGIGVIKPLPAKAKGEGDDDEDGDDEEAA